MAVKPFESTVQDLVYNLDTGIGLRLVQIGLSILALLGLIVIYTATQFKGLKDPLAMEYAQLGRNLMEKKSFVTQTVRPATMAFQMQNPPLRNPPADGRPPVVNHPDVLHAPLYPVLLAGGFSAFPQSLRGLKPLGVLPAEHWVIIPINMLFALLSGLLVLLLGQRLFNLRLGLLAMTVYFLSNLVWSDAISGLGLTVVTFLVLAAVYTAVRAVSARETHPAFRHWFPWFLLSAGFTALAFLTRYGAAVLVPGLMLYIGLGFQRRRFWWALLFGGMVLGCVSPWIARNVLVCRSPLGYAPYTAFEESTAADPDPAQRTLAVPQAGAADFRGLQRKFLVRMQEIYKNRLDQLGDGPLPALFFAAFFFRFIRRDVHALRWCLALSMMLLILLAAVFSDDTLRLLHVFWPFVLLYGLAFFQILLERLRLALRASNIAVTVLMVLLSATPLVIVLLPPKAEIPYPPYYSFYIGHACSALEPTEAMMTDMPWATAWYGHATSIYLPRSLDEFYEINDRHKHISALYFTSLTTDLPYIRTLRTGPYKTWFPILVNSFPPDFPLMVPRSYNNLDQLLLMDRPRTPRQTF